MDHEFVKDQLTKLGYTNLDDDLIDEFLEKLQEEDELPVIPTIPKRFSTTVTTTTTTTKTTKYHNEDISQKQSSLQRTNKTITNNEDNSIPKKNYINHNGKNKIKSTKTTRNRNKTKTLTKESTHKDNEILEWSQKLKTIRKKGKNLDNRFQRYKSKISYASDEIIDVPIYFGPDADKMYDPYPYVIKMRSGGFIRPPPIHGTRKYIHPNGHKLTYEERFPYYIPVPERRGDELRWRIRQKLIYSDPKYH